MKEVKLRSLVWLVDDGVIWRRLMMSLEWLQIERSDRAEMYLRALGCGADHGLTGGARPKRDVNTQVRCRNTSVLYSKYVLEVGCVRKHSVQLGHCVRTIRAFACDLARVNIGIKHVMTHFARVVVL